MQPKYNTIFCLLNNLCVLITWCKAFVSFLALCHTSSEWNISRRADNVSTKIKWKTYNYSTEWFYNETTPHFSSPTFRWFSEPAMKKFRLHYSLGPSNCSSGHSAVLHCASVLHIISHIISVRALKKRLFLCGWTSPWRWTTTFLKMSTVTYHFFRLFCIE